jgi:sugar lactone lactonase YvrE
LQCHGFAVIRAAWLQTLAEETTMPGKRYLVAAGLAAVAAVLALSSSMTDAAQGSSPRIPVYAVDAHWPRMPLPSAGQWGTPVEISSSTGKVKPWSMGEVTGTCIDSRDHVFVVTRGNLVNPSETLDSVSAPPVIEFSPDGRVVNAWGDRSVMPNGIHGCFIDYQDNIWISGSGDGIVQKYTHDGRRMLLQIGVRGQCDFPANNNVCGDSSADPKANRSKTLLNQPASVYVDPHRDPMTRKRGSIYIADGYGNHRIVVFQDNGDGTSTWLRQWGSPTGAAMNAVTNFPATFATGGGGHPHCVAIGNDGLVYVCDRGNDRIQVFDKEGQLQRIIPVVPGTGATRGVNEAPALGTAGSAGALAFSNDAKQTLMFVADGGNEILHILNRSLGTLLSSFGAPGLQAGQFTALHSVSMDSKGNLYTGETINGRRIQKFVRVDGHRRSRSGSGGRR